MSALALYIDGGYVNATSNKTFDTINPATGEVIASIQSASQDDINKAVESAKAGQKVWASMTAVERSRILLKAVAILRERNDALAKLETADTGKAISETGTVDIVTGADVLEYYVIGPRLLRAFKCRCANRAFFIPAVSLWAWWQALARGIIPSKSLYGNLRLHWPRAMR